MQDHINKNMHKIFTEFSKLNKSTKTVLKYGIQFSTLLLLASSIFVFINRYLLGYDLYLDFIATSVVKNSVIIFAEIVIGCLVVDYAYSNGK